MNDITFEFHGPENQLWLEEWLNLKLRVDRVFIGSLNEHKSDLKNLNLSWQHLKGKFVIENFPDLVTLNLGNNQLSEVEIKNCPKLEEIIVSHNKLKDLKIENCPEITDLYTSYNELTELDVSNLKKLETLSYDKNRLFTEERCRLSRLGLPKERKKGKRFSSGSFRKFFKEFIKNKENKQKATEIDISNSGSMLGSKKKKLEIKTYPKLTHLNVDNCNLKNLKIKNCLNLKTLSFRFNQIEEIDLKDLPNLEGLYCSGNKIESLDLTNNLKLKHLVCDNNPIISRKLKLTHLKDLESLYFFKCFLVRLYVTGLKNLK